MAHDPAGINGYKLVTMFTKGRTRSATTPGPFLWDLNKAIGTEESKGL